MAGLRGLAVLSVADRLLAQRESELGSGGSVSLAVLRGGFFGLLCYATYDLTTLATVKGWPLLVTVVDLVWGTVLTAAITLFSVWLGRKWV
jgi:uncharacterized membrane protein